QSGSGCRAAEFEIGADVLQILEHVDQTAGDGHLRHGKGKLAIANPQAGRAARVVAGHDVDSEPHQLGNVETVGNRFQDLFRRFAASLHEQVAVADPGVSGDSTGSVAGRFHAQLARRVRVHQVALEHTFLDHHSAACRYALIVEGRCA